MLTVQVRSRSDEKKRPHRVAEDGGYGLVEAYSEACFEKPPRFFIASSEHPKLGKWAQRSTLKKKYYPVAGCFVDQTAAAASQRSTIRPTVPSSSSCPLVGIEGSQTTAPSSGFRGSRRSGKGISTSYGATNCLRRCRPEASARRRGEPRSTRFLPRDIKPLVECLPETPKFGWPRVYTPVVSGRVVVSVHPRNLENVAIASAASTLLRGSFGQQNDHQPSQRGESTDVGRSPPVSSDDQASPEADTRDISVIISRSEAVLEGSDVKPKTAVVLPPEIRYRVRPEDASLDMKTNDHDEGKGIGENSDQVLKGILSGSNATCKSLDGDCAVGKQEQILSEDACQSGCTTASSRPEAENNLDKVKKKRDADDETQGDSWVLSEVDPFMLALRRALLHDRPAEFPAYVAEFAADWYQDRKPN